ncbi:MAG: hypothetical protein ACK5LS_08495 [Propioniciclava sp.]
MNLIARRGFLTVSLSAPLWLAACSARGSDPTPEIPEELEPFTPTGTPVPSPTPATDLPPGFRTVSGAGFTIAIPETWNDSFVDAVDSQGSDGWAFQDPDADDPLQYVGVLLDAEPVSGAIEQSAALEASLKAQQATGLERGLISWPNTVYAVLVDWQLNDTRKRQLMAERTEGGPILNVTLSAAVGSDAWSTLEAILSTFALTD